VYAEEWVVCAAITELASDIGTAQETINTMTLIAASATSKKWIPARRSCLTPGRRTKEQIHRLAYVAVTRAKER